MFILLTADLMQKLILLEIFISKIQVENKNMTSFNPLREMTNQTVLITDWILVFAF